MKYIEGWCRPQVIRTTAFVVLALVAFPLAAKADRDALWNLVERGCVPDQQEHGNPAPCAQVDLSAGAEGGFVVLKDNDRWKPHAFLLIPTKRLPGIESPELLAAGAPNYFQHAWAARAHLMSLLKLELAWDMVGLAVNSAADRTQDQLHIHIDCIRPEIRDALRGNEDAINDQWSELNLPAPDHPYMAIKLAADSLGESDPFQLLADGNLDAKDQMGLETLALVGAVFKNGTRGFYALSSRHVAGMPATSEDLLDPTCALAGTAN